MNKTIAIIVPCYNEAARFPVKYWKEIVRTENDIKWLFVDDGSYDRTFEILQEVCSGTSSRAIKRLQNGGKGRAIQQGLLEVLENDPALQVLGYLDSDGAFSKEDVFRLAKMSIDGSRNISTSKMDAVISSRVSLSGRKINRKSSRHYLGRLIATYLTRKWSDAPYDTQSGYKLFVNSNSFREAIKADFSTKWFVDIELITRIGINNKGLLNIWEEPLLSWTDVDGSNLKLRQFYNIFLEIISARRLVRMLLAERVK
jgi:glycosyltransferase involved in cell wall biosynthesis